MVPTPKTQDRKRKSSGNNDDTDSPAKKRIGKTKETVINLDVEDPFNFEKKKDSHPEPLKNINVSLINKNIKNKLLLLFFFVFSD